MVANLEAVFSPHSAAVVGASASPGKLGHLVLENMKQGGFPGPLYAVNPNESDILGLPTYPDLAHVPGRVDLVIVSVPASAVLAVMQQAVERGARGAVIISAGFSETQTRQGIEAERALARLAEESGMAIIGPNCQGVISAGGSVSAWFGSLPQASGTGLFISQSGGLAGTLVEYLNHRRVSLVEAVVSLGNKCAVDEADLLEAACSNERIRFAMCYIEGFRPGRGRAFAEVARTFSEQKPIVVLKGGRSPAGERATSSHTGALAGSDRIFLGAMRQAGVVVADSVRDFVGVARMIGAQPPLSGNRILILTNLGGPAAIATDICERHGLSVGPTPDSLRSLLAERIPGYCSMANPIDLAGDPAPGRYGAILDLVYEHEAFDAVLVVAAPMSGAEQIARDIVRAYQAHPKPTAVCWMSEGAYPVVRPILEAGSLPVFEMPEDAVRALAGANERSLMAGGHGGRGSPREHE